MAYLNSLYPGVSLRIQIHSLMNNLSPFCKSCGSPVKNYGKATCSVACRETLKKQDGSREAKIASYKKTWADKYSGEGIYSVFFDTCFLTHLGDLLILRSMFVSVFF